MGGRRGAFCILFGREFPRAHSDPISLPVPPSSSPATSTATQRTEVFFDGECPLCTREIRLLRRLDRHGRIRFTDIAAPGFDASTTPWSRDELMASIRGRNADGDPIEGVEVFRALYAAVGLGPVVALTRVPGVRHVLDAAYAFFARHRLRLTGRCNSESCAVG